MSGIQGAALRSMVLVALGVGICLICPRWARAGDGDAKEPAPAKREGDREGEVRREGDRDAVRRDGEGDRAVKEGARDGEVKREGDRAVKEAARDGIRREGEGDRVKEAGRDGIRREGEGERVKEAGRDGVRREGEAARRDADTPIRRPRPINGIVLRVEDTNLILAVGDAGREAIVATQDDTEVYVNGIRAKLADLKANQAVSVTQVEGLTRRIDARTRERGPRDERPPRQPAKEAGKER